MFHKKLSEAGIPINRIGMEPIVKSGELYREDFEDRIEVTWIPEEMENKPCESQSNKGKK